MPLSPPLKSLLPLLTTHQIRQWEGRGNQLGFTTEAMVEVAAERIFVWLKERSKDVSPSKLKLLFLCGPGLNGADSYAVARKFSEVGSKCFFLEVLPATHPVTKIQKHLALMAGCEELQDSSELMATYWDSDFVLDGIFGAGLSRNLEGPVLDLVEKLLQNDTQEREPSRPLFIAIDCPTGMEADTGKPLPVCLKCHETLVMSAFKPGLLSDFSLEFTGKLHLIPMGIPDFSGFQRSGSSPWAEGSGVPSLPGWVSIPQASEADFEKKFTKKPYENKLSRGVLSLVVGSDPFPGAGKLVVKEALALAPGFVQIFTHSGLLKANLLEQAPEVVQCPGLETWEQEVPESLLRSKVILIGSGCLAPTSQQQVIWTTFLKQAKQKSVLKTIIFDAGWCLGELISPAVEAGFECVALPHLGEFARMCPKLHGRLVAGRASKAQTALEASQALGCYVLLKGPYNALASPRAGDEPRCIQTALPCPQLAVAGSGDRLAGRLAAAWLHDLHLNPTGSRWDVFLGSVQFMLSKPMP